MSVAQVMETNPLKTRDLCYCGKGMSYLRRIHRLANWRSEYEVSILPGWTEFYVSYQLGSSYLT